MICSRDAYNELNWLQVCISVHMRCIHMPISCDNLVGICGSVPWLLIEFVSFYD